jgi:hypothetical protein
MIATLPPMNMLGTCFSDERAIECCFAEDMIYVAISGGRAVIGYQTVSRIAAKYGVGVYALSDDGAVWFPRAGGGLGKL